MSYSVEKAERDRLNRPSPDQERSPLFRRKTVSCPHYLFTACCLNNGVVKFEDAYPFEGFPSTSIIGIREEYLPYEAFCKAFEPLNDAARELMGLDYVPRSEGD